MTMTWPRYFAKSTMLPSMSLARKAYTLSAFVGSHKFGSAMKRFVALQDPPPGSQDVAIPTAASVIMGLNIRVLPGDATALETCRNIPANIVTQLEVGD